jgi:hypothetical protein
VALLFIHHGLFEFGEYLASGLSGADTAAPGMSKEFAAPPAAMIRWS